MERRWRGRPGYRGTDAHSVALAGFGLDSLIEILASTVVVWQLTELGWYRERVAMRIIGGAFLALAIYIAAQARTCSSLGARPARHYSASSGRPSPAW